MSANAQQQKVPLGILTAMVVGGMVGADAREIERFPEDGVRLVENQAAGRGDAGEALAAALEDRDAEFFLEQADLFRDPGLGGEQRRRRLGDIQSAPLDFDQVFQLLEFHVGSL